MQSKNFWTAGLLVLVLAIALPSFLAVRPKVVPPAGLPVSGTVTPVSFSPGDNPPISPFTGVRFGTGTTEVEVYGRWYYLISIEGVPVKAILAFARKRFTGQWQKRFCEDLVWVLEEMGHLPPPAVDLVLQEMDSGAMVRLEDVVMTYENRRLVRDTWR